MLAYTADRVESLPDLHVSVYAISLPVVTTTNSITAADIFSPKYPGERQFRKTYPEKVQKMHWRNIESVKRLVGELVKPQHFKARYLSSQKNWLFRLPSTIFIISAGFIVQYCPIGNMEVGSRFDVLDAPISNSLGILPKKHRRY